MGLVAISRIRKGFLIYEEMSKYFTIYEEAVSHIWLCTRSLWISLFMRKIFFSFLSVRWTKHSSEGISCLMLLSLYVPTVVAISIIKMKNWIISYSLILFIRMLSAGTLIRGLQLRKMGSRKIRILWFYMLYVYTGKCCGGRKKGETAKGIYLLNGRKRERSEVKVNCPRSPNYQ